MDHSKKIWITNNGNKSVTELTKESDYSPDKALNISGGITEIHDPTGIAVDGMDNIWVANAYNASVTEFTKASGYSPYCCDIDLGREYEIQEPVGNRHRSVWKCLGHELP